MNKMRIKQGLMLVIAGLLLSFCSAHLAYADGGIMPRPDHYANETTQKAFIYYQNQTENLVIATSYQGDNSDFAWIIPVPNKPEINKSKVDIFNNLAEITWTPGPAIVYSGSNFGLSAAPKSTPVEVISTKTIDVYDTAVLKATDEKSLSDWLSANGYAFPADQTPALKSYVDSGWYFVAAKISASVAGDAAVKNQLETGMLTPLRLTFASDKIIYPMKLTGLALDIASENSSKLGVNSPGKYIGLTLYVLSDSRTNQSFLNTDWANWLDSSEVNELNNGGWIKSDNKLFLTKMAADVNLKNMSDDFVIERYDNNNVYPVPPDKTADFWLTNVLALIATILMSVLLLPGLIFVIFIILQSFAKNKAVYIIGSIYQILYCMALIFIWLATYSVAVANGDQPFLSQYGLIGITLGLLIVLIVAILFIIKIMKRYKKIFSN